MAFGYGGNSGNGGVFGVNHAAGVIVIGALVLLLIMNRAFATVSVGIG